MIFLHRKKNTKKFSRGIHIYNLEEDGRIKLVTHFFEQASVLQACTIPLMANFFQLVVSMICTESPSPPRIANFKIILSPEGVVNVHNNCNCKDDKKGVLIGYSDHALEGGECLLTSITGEALKKTLAQSSDHFPEVVNACSQESLRQD
jgi:hypothetical protein